MPLAHGAFGFDDYVEHLISFLEAIGPGAHVVAVCQPCVAALVAAAVMAEEDHPAQPRSLTLMAGPIDTRVNSDPGERARQQQADRMVRAEPDQRACRCRYAGADAPRLSRLRAARRLHEHEHRASRQGSTATLYSISATARSRRRRRPRISTTSISRCSTCRAEFYLETVRAGVPGARPAGGTLTWRGAAGRAARDQAARAAHRRRREATTSARSARRWPRTICARAPAVPQASPHAGGRRPLRRIFRQALGEPDLSAGEKRDPVERMIA